MRLLFRSFVPALLILHSVASAQVSFDVSPTLAFSYLDKASSAARKELQATVSVSMFVPPNRDVTHVLYHFYFPEGSAQIVEYTPQTQLETDVVGTIQVSENSEAGSSVSLGANGDLEGWVRANAAVGESRSLGTNQRFERRPPVETVLTAGTSHRGRGVYFMLADSATSTLHGARKMQLKISVPTDWRGGYMRMVAQARNNKRTYPAGSFLIPVYRKGDEDAAQIAAQLLTFERHFLQSAETHRAAIERAQRPTLAHDLALKSPEIPDDWQDRLLWRTTDQPAPEFHDHLPQPVRLAALDLHSAKRLAASLGHPSVTLHESTRQVVLKPR